ncbi:glycogenin-2 isoform X1 [Sarcophilus harrisii]|uniref:glycogenin glucosyltransferase n=1 Tax=Sarcophilus harrisii TaxID=9305 RepID=G3W791_SARHA|nr:glycogenin-2 isoform X1 [Sarcophilus harrisii]XP_023356128.1 glycogenin-2 isoform X1 [Sarcophilus harrisii]
MMSVTDQAFVTLATNDVYCQGALVLGQSLKNHRLTRKLVILITSQVSRILRDVLYKVFDEVIEVDLEDSADYVHLALLKRPELGVTFTKLHCWTLTHYSKCVFMDADTLVLCNIDELFDREELSAAPDSGWPDCFNSGVFVFQPSLETHNLLMQHAVECGSFDGADQGLLNSFFSNWATSDIHKHLPFLYNLSSSTIYTYSPAFNKFGSDVKVVHFLGPSKPWHYKYNRQTGSVISESLTSDSQHHVSFLDLWWKIYDESIVPFFDKVQHVAEHESQEQTISLCGAAKSWKSPNSSQEHKQYLPVQEFSEQTLEITLPILIPEVTEKDQPVQKDEHNSPECFLEPNNEPLVEFTSEPVPLHSLEQPVHKEEPNSPECFLEQNNEPSAQFTSDPVSLHNLEVELAFSVTELSIQQKVKEPSAEEERRKWEEGRVDYMGKDAFARIQEKLDRFLQ